MSALLLVEQVPVAVACLQVVNRCECCGVELHICNQAAATAFDTYKRSSDYMLHAFRWLLASRKYERGLKLVEHMDKASPEQERAVGNLRRSCNLNLAAVYLKLDNPVAAQKAASVVSSLLACRKGWR